MTKRGEQYTGWTALPPPKENQFKSRLDALRFIDRLVYRGVGNVAGVDAAGIDMAIREAEKKTHPDHGGNPDDFKAVQAARKLILGA